MFISNTSFPVDRGDFTDTILYQMCGRFTGAVSTNTTDRVTCLPKAIRGRFVYITMLMPDAVLCLCEIEIHAGKF